MRHYHKNKYIKKLNLFSKDAVKSLDTSGARYDTFTWNNIRDLGLYCDCKMKIGSLDFDTNANADVDIQAPVPPDDLVVHYKFDGDFLDSSGYDYHILENEGGVSIDTADYKKGTGSVNFDATLTKGLWIDKISIKQSRISPHVYQNPNGMTISFWVKLTSAGLLGSVWERLFQAHKTTSSSANDYCAIESTGGQKDISFIVAGNGVLSKFNKSITSLADKWFHLTWVLIPNNTNWLAAEHTWKIYIDGVLTDTKINMYYPEWNDDWDFTLGKWASGVVSGNEREMDGNLDDFRIYDRELSSDEINRIMAEIQKDPIVHYKFENNLIDETGNTLLTQLGSGTNAVFSDLIKKRGTHSLKNETSVQSFNNKTLLNTKKQFTLSYWCMFHTISGFNQIIIYQRDTILIMYAATLSKFYVTLNNNNSNYYVFDFDLTGSLDKWVHITFTIDFLLTDNHISMFINGVPANRTKVGSGINGTQFVSSSYILGILGNTDTPTGGYYMAYVDDFRIYDKALDANEIREVMWENRGLFMWYKFEPVINNFVANNDLLCHLEFENLTNVNDNVIIDSTGRNSIVSLSGQTYTGLRSTDRKRGNYSFYGGLLNPEFYFTDNKNVIPNGTKQLTIAFWIKPTSTTGQFIMRGRPNALILSQSTTYNFAIIQGNTNLNIISTYAPTLNTWEHIAITLDYTTSTYETFKNGVKDTGSWTENSKVFDPNGFENVTASSTDVSNGMFCLFMNSWTNGIQHFEGYCDDFRIYSKVLTEDEIQSLYSRYLTFQDGMYNTIMTDEHSGFDVSTVKKQGNYSLDLTGGIKGGSITLTDGDVNLFENLQRISFCTWVYLTGFNEFMFVFYQEPVLSVYLQYSTSRIHVLLGEGQLMYWQLTIEEIVNTYLDKWKHVTVVIDFSETDPLQKVLLYIDGVSKGAGTMSGSTSLTAYPSTTNKFYVGSYFGDSSGFYGYIDDLRVYTFQVEPDDIALIMADAEEKNKSIYNIKCNEVYDTYESNSKTPTIYHNRGVLRNKHIINPYFKVNTPLNSLSLNITHFVDGAFEPRGLEPEDQFMITLLVQEDDKKETAEGNRIEYYHRNPQFRIKY